MQLISTRSLFKTYKSKSPRLAPWWQTNEINIQGIFQIMPGDKSIQTQNLAPAHLNLSIFPRHPER